MRSEKYSLPSPSSILDSRWLLLVIFILALAIRLYFNLVLNPFDTKLFSDMKDYNDQANLLLANPFVHNASMALWPPGTVIILALTKLIFGINNFKAIAVLYALFGAGNVLLAYLIAQRVTRVSFIALIVAIIGIFNVNQIMLGSYILSHTPYGFFMLLGLWFLIKLVDSGSYRNAILAGIFLGIALLIRPDVLIFLVLLIGFYLFSSKKFILINFKHWLCLVSPVLICLIFSAIKLYIHTGRYGIISENGTYVLVAARCHNIWTTADDGKEAVNYGSAGMRFLQNAEEQSKQRSEQSFLKLDPAFDLVREYKGYIGQRDKHFELVKECIAKTGIIKQIIYSFTNIMLLWHYQVWPIYSYSGGPLVVFDMTNYGLGEGVDYKLAPLNDQWNNLFKFYFMVPSFIAAVIFLFSRHNVKLNIVALNYLSLIILAGILYGEVRYRIAYDDVIVLLSLELYFMMGQSFLKWYRNNNNF